jgi:hypothetical protein
VTAPPVFVIPLEERILKGLSGQRLIFRTKSLGDISAIREVAARVQCRLEAVILEADLPVTSLPFEENWRTIPLLIHAPELGRVSHLLHHIPIIRGMSLRIMLPTEGEDNYTSLRILSSLGIPSGFLLRGDTADWEQLLDLATYYYFSIVNHAPVAPLDSFAEGYVPGEGSFFGSAYLEDPDTTYLHLNRKGEVALSEADLVRGKIRYLSLDDLAREGMQTDSEGRAQPLSGLFTSTSPCPKCPALKICRGRVAHEDGTVPDGCSSFFVELMGMIEEYQDMRDGRGS